ncbi:MAG: HTH domain-containing protein [Chitinophagaceae bacterium]|nr:HTH domain-containing protein [Chitinophagaceae bacterium]MBL0054731.1 HTH domain-containing protein [Chitinophagaceae bacterium]
MPRKFIERFKRIDEIIKNKSSGTPAQLAAKLDISESTLYEFIAVMKEMGAPIQYDKFAQRYVYEFPGHFNISFLEK